MIPRATYRLQFSKEFTFDDALRVVPYLARLGVSHVYASPILAARKGSPHGYDVVDHSRINPELGGEEAFRRFVAELRARGLGLIVDIVPNHMAAGGENAWWMDVLEHGRSSAFASNFDIDWEPTDPSLRNRVLLPILATSLVEALARNKITIASESERPHLRYADYRLPLRPEDARAISRLSSDDYERKDFLVALLERQHYRLAWWRVAGDTINWRRFFDINDLIALRVEDEGVFEQVHAKHLALFGQGLIDGFRVDHIDGLADPASYCRKLRARLSELDSRGAYLIVEKILASGEDLPRDWGIDGTTGYDFMNDASALLHDPKGAHPLADLWASFSGWFADFETADRLARRRILDREFRGAFETAVAAFQRLATRSGNDLTRGAMERALTRLLTELRIYRTYATGESDSPPPGELFESAATRALHRAPDDDAAAIRLIVEILSHGDSSNLRRNAARRFNQLAAPLAAKADEDTAYYRYGRLLSRNEVGADPGQFAITADEFHSRAQKRLTFRPLLATATHDHKRGEDARLRLAVLSEIPDEWGAAVGRWFAMNAPIRDVLIDKGDEYQLYQALVGSWPPELGSEDGGALQSFAQRIAGWRLKSLREAKLRTSWGDPDERFEKANLELVKRLLDPLTSRAFLRDITAFVGRIAPAAALNSFVQCVLRNTSPGIPDLYQGAEFWDFSLVDPDNRRPVDYESRELTLEHIHHEPAQWRDWRSGAAKQRLISSLLALRTKFESCFAEGDYRPLSARGPRANHVVGFTRSLEDKQVLVAVARLCARPCIDTAQLIPPSEFWSETVLDIPLSCAWRSAITDQQFVCSLGAISCGNLFETFPAAVLVSE